MNYIWRPAEFFYGFQDAATEEYHPVLIVLEIFLLGITEYQLSLKILFVVDEIDLHPGTLDGSYLDDKRMVVVVDNQVHPAQPDDFMQLVTPFIYNTKTWHKRPDFLSSLLRSLW